MAPDSPAICRLWAVRLIKGRRLAASIYESLVLDDVPAFLRKPGRKSQKLTMAAFQGYIEQRLQSLEKLTSFQLPTALAQNIDSISKMLGLSFAEQTIFTFAVLLITDTTLINVASNMRPIKKAELVKLLAQVLGLSEALVKTALKRGSNLLKSGLIILQPGPSMALEEVFDFVTFGFVNNLFDEHKHVFCMSRDVLQHAFLKEHRC